MLHKEAMEMKKQEIENHHQALQFQLTQHQDEMRLGFLEMEQHLKQLLC
jgi:hypothetical protein